MAENTTASKEALRNKEACASACFYAMHNLFNNDWLNWEPETLWLELSRQGVSVSVSNRAKILAARNLLLSKAFWYDAQAFDATAIVFNNGIPTHHGIEDAPVCFLNWAVFEANEIHKAFENDTLTFDREPIAFTALQLHKEGFVIPPPLLDMASEELARLLPKTAKEMAKTIRKAWADAPKSDKLKDAAYPETPEGVQLLRLAAVQVYFDERCQLREKQLAPLKSSDRYHW